MTWYVLAGKPVRAPGSRELGGNVSRSGRPDKESVPANRGPLLGVDFLNVAGFQPQDFKNVRLLGRLHASSILNIEEFPQGGSQALQDSNEHREDVKVPTARASYP